MTTIDIIRLHFTDPAVLPQHWHTAKFYSRLAAWDFWHAAKQAKETIVAVEWVVETRNEKGEKISEISEDLKYLN